MSALAFLRGPKAAPFPWNAWRAQYDGFQADLLPPLFEWAVALGGLWVLPPAAKGEVAAAFGLLCALLQTPVAQARTFKVCPNLAKMIDQWTGGPTLVPGEDGGGGTGVHDVASHVAGLLRQTYEGVDHDFTGPQALHPRDVRRVIVFSGDPEIGSVGFPRQG